MKCILALPYLDGGLWLDGALGQLDVFHVDFSSLVAVGLFVGFQVLEVFDCYWVSQGSCYEAC